MSMADPLPEEDELLAAELALGLLDADERRVPEARVAGDAPFAAAVERWRGYAAGLFSGPGEVPSPSVWTRIEARLPANDVAPAPAAAVRWWQAGTLTASAAAIVLAVIAIQRPPVPPPATVIAQAPLAAPPLVAVLSAPDGSGVLTVSYDRVTHRITAAPNGVAIGNYAAELWVIPADGKPRSLGVIADMVPSWTQPPLPAASAIAPGATLAISVEPLGGSPTGQPTGKVILTGKVAAI